MQDSKNNLQCSSKDESTVPSSSLSHPKEGNLMVYNQFQARTGPEKNAAPPAAVWKVPYLSCHSQQHKPSFPFCLPAEKGAPIAAGHLVLLQMHMGKRQLLCSTMLDVQEKYRGDFLSEGRSIDSRQNVINYTCLSHFLHSDWPSRMLCPQFSLLRTACCQCKSF